MCAFPVLASAAGAAKVDIEQVRTDLPEVRAYFYLDGADGIAAADVSATLGGKALATESVALLPESDAGVDYYVLADISGSIDDEQLAAMKKALKPLSDGLGSADNLVLISVGDRADTLLTGTEASKQRAKAIAKLGNGDATTHLYDAIDKALSLAESNAAGLGSKSEIIVITDGADDTDGGTATKQETLDSLSESGIPIHALCFAGGDRGARDNLGEISRKSGGDMVSVSAENIVAKLTDAIGRIKGGYVAVFKAESNVVEKEMQSFSIEVKAGENTLTDKTAAAVRSATADTTAPEIVGEPKQLKGKDGISIEFSEPVAGADDKDAYIIKDGDGKKLRIKSVAYRKGAFGAAGAGSGTDATDAAGESVAASVEIVFTEEPYSGRYEISFVGITDISKEKNQLNGKAGFSYEGRSEVQKNTDSILGMLRAYWWAVLIAGIAIIVLLALRYIRKRGGLIRVDGKIGFGDMAEFKHHFSTPDTGDVSLVVTDTRGKSQRVDIGIEKSFFVGRSGINNLSFDDDKMSRQHFVIEAEGDDYFITDLNTTNGTFLNGVPVKARRKVSNKDVITAGREKFVFRVWQGQ
ncbi:MAG: FHA domain-containing protein [Clostridiales Family XIII bacterium]|nr:FHA domain-containing protein [Clostridiales Family XIII bacterium]